MEEKISIIVVNYNTGDLLVRCLESIAENVTVDYEVVVFDNASKDSSVGLCAEFKNNPKFIFILSDVNLGFAKANNRAAEIATGGFFHFLNPDTELSAGINADYQKVFLNPEDAFVNPLLNPDGRLENRPMPIPVIRDMFYWYFCRKKARIWYKGASVIVSREVFFRIGKWCEDYFMYAEDLDFFYTLQRMGVEIKSLDSTIFHFGGASSSSRWTNLEREVVVQRSARKFYKKYFSVTHYNLIKIYFIFHYLLKNPKRVSDDIRAWKLSKHDKILDKC